MKREIQHWHVCLALACILSSVVACKKQDLPPSSITNNPTAGLTVLRHTKQFSGNVPAQWYLMLTEVARTKPYVPPQCARIFGYSGLALYEAVLPGMPSYQSVFAQLTGITVGVGNKKDYYWPAAANAALARITTRLMSVYGAVPAQVADLEARLHSDFSAQTTPEQLQLSIDRGREVADAIFEWSKTDGAVTAAGTPAPCPPYVPRGGAGNWVPTPPAYFPASGQCQGNLRTFLPGVVESERPAAPLAYSTSTSSAFYAAAEEVYNLRNAGTPTDDLNSHYWQDLYGTNYNTLCHMFRLTAQFVTDENMNLEDAAVLFAKEGMAMSDAVAVSIGAKFYYSLLRPVTYIQQVMGHTTWSSLYPTPQHPSYPCVATAVAASSVQVLETTFGKQYAFSDGLQSTLYGVWDYDSLDEMLENVARSRTYSGLNFRFAVDEGTRLGRKIGQMIDALPFKK